VLTIERIQGGHCATFFVFLAAWRRAVQGVLLACLAMLSIKPTHGFPIQAGSAAGGDGAHTRFSLLADVRTVQPGVPFTVGILMTMDPGWHTYWKNPGESGLATSVRWTLPEGFTVGEIQWPLPEKKIEAGDVLTYGYADENMLLATVTPAASIQPGTTVTLRADAEWLECERTCVPGGAAGEAVLGVSVSAPVPANQNVFERFRRAVPRPWSDTTGFTVAVSGEAGTLDLRLSPTGGARFVVQGEGAPDFYPEPFEGMNVGRAQVNAQPTDVRIRIPIKVRTTGTGDLEIVGVIVYRMEGGERHGAVVHLSLPPGLLGVPGSGERSASAILDQSFSLQESGGGREPVVVYLLFAVLGGILLNIMPCVLPVIALKIFGIVRMAGDRPAQVRKLGWFFSLGILTSFIVLALTVIILKVAGQQVGWGFQFQEPVFVMAMSALVFAFGLSLFGVYEIRLPGVAVSGVSNAISHQAGGGKGYTASFSEGIFATILATPCTAPFLGSALGFAFSQPWWIILLIFVAVAVGMALPYLILTAKPTWMKFLPKPGPWMESAKQFMGFLMMATLLWLLYVLGKQLGMEAVVWTGAFLLTVGIACWLIGRFATLTASRRTTIVTWLLALLAVSLGFWFFAEPILKARALIAEDAVEASGGGSAEADRIAWEAFSLQGLESHLRSGKGVFLDFTAEWCLTCKVNEKAVLADAEVVAAIRTSGLVPIRADWTNRNPEITRLLAKFGRSGVPLYVIFPPGKSSQPLILPEVITPGIVLEAIQKGSRGGD
jgi:thiol:disulfide interchange protein/DsbC/DsbD-like thiol-disulfide interchange protein